MDPTTNLMFRIVVLLICSVELTFETLSPAIWSRSKKVKLVFDDDDRSQIICYKPEDLKPQFQNLWSSVQFSFSSPDSDYSVCHGDNETDVEEQCMRFSRFTRYFLIWRVQSLSVSPFNKSCVLVEASEPVSVELQIRRFDVWIFARLIFGVLLFFFASKLSRNVIFYYASGISLGVLASVLVTIFLLSRFMPKKGLAFGFLAASFSATAYFVRRSWNEVQTFAYSHIEYFVVYFVISGLLGFAIFYYKGPVSNPRLLNIMKWTIQMFALVLIYSGTQISAVSGTFVILTIVTYLIPSFSCGLGEKLKRSWRRRFPKKIRLLTEDEFHEQARVETQRALEELRSFCRSPDCQAWKTISRLNSPARFAHWIEGDSDHIQDQEIYEHDMNPSPRLQYDDDLEDE